MSVQQEANGGEWGQVANGGNIKKNATNCHQWSPMVRIRVAVQDIEKLSLSNEVD